MSTAEAALARVRALLVDPRGHQLCLCGAQPAITPEALHRALKGAR